MHLDDEARLGLQATKLGLSSEVCLRIHAAADLWLVQTLNR